jgi:hypothetical protein
MPSLFGYDFGVDRESRLLRIWSNKELRQFAPFFEGAVVNVSAWKDEDKEGSHYRDYFKSAASYTITNWHGVRGTQGRDDELLLDLEVSLPDELVGKFDVVFNHTTLEHTFHVFLAFHNLCLMSKDIAIIVVPCLQRVHFGFHDYWRFTPFTLRKLFEENQMSVIYESISPYEENASIYLFCVASRYSARWASILPHQQLEDTFIGSIGANIVRNDPFTHLSTIVYRVLKGPMQIMKRITKRAKL